MQTKMHAESRQATDREVFEQRDGQIFVNFFFRLSLSDKSKNRTFADRTIKLKFPDAFLLP